MSIVRIGKTCLLVDPTTDDGIGSSYLGEASSSGMGSEIFTELTVGI
jgi:hypothetical protein